MNRLLLSLFLCNCASIRSNNLYLDFYNQTEGRYIEIRQCSLPIAISFSGLSTSEENKVKRGLRFWEKYAGRRLFVESPNAAVVFENYPHEYYEFAGATTSSIWDSNGCFIFSVVRFMYRLDSFSEWEQDFIIRHEIGHLLGFSDSDDRFHIMYHHVKINVDCPSDSELDALRRYYVNESR